MNSVHYYLFHVIVISGRVLFVGFDCLLLVFFVPIR